MKNTNWKVPVIIAVGVVAIILLIIFGSQSFFVKTSIQAFFEPDSFILTMIEQIKKEDFI